MRLLIGPATIPTPEPGIVSHVVPEGVVVMRHDDWLAIQDAVAIAKVGKILTETHRARLDSILIEHITYDEAEADTADGVSWGVNPQVGDRVVFTSTEYPSAGEKSGVITDLGHDGWGREQVYVAGDQNTFGEVILVAAFNGVVHEDQPYVARIITD